MIWEGWNLGSVTIRRVRLDETGAAGVQSRRHGGNLEGTIRTMLAESDGAAEATVGATVTGPLAASLFDLPYLPEPVSIEKALEGLQLKPDIVLSLGGESFVVYCLHDGRVRKMAASNRCAAGSGEFIVQQLGRMGMELEEGLAQARPGKHVALASRCSVHIKSDATHKLNKGECSPLDIAYTLVVDLAAKIQTLIDSTAWPQGTILVCGGMAQNDLLVEELRRLLPESQVETVAQSPYLEAYGAAIAARSNGRLDRPVAACLASGSAQRFETLPPLAGARELVTANPAQPPLAPVPGMKVLLGIDAGSTTTKAALLEMTSGRMLAAIYLRTHGNPVQAANQCLAAVAQQLDGCPVEIVQTAVTGSGRELVSVALGNCLSFNEILAHARAARLAHPDVDTIFEIGGQDAKFISLLGGIPVDYAMNDGCSAGTGSFLEEAAASDMKYGAEEIGPLALAARSPLAFGERCAAFINSEIRTALQGGEDPKNILAGLVYSIVKNYLSRVVGTRQIGSTVLLQGGVALNAAVAPAVAALSGRRVVIPSHPELMGCFGAALMARDLMEEGRVGEEPAALEALQTMQMAPLPGFTCRSCANRCAVQRIRIGEKSYPFGGLCSRWEMQRRPKSLRYGEGQDLVGLRSKLMFETFAPPAPAEPVRGRVGLPLALTTYLLYPFCARLLAELGFEVVLSRPGSGRTHTNAPFCYPAELLHAAVDDLLQQGVDWVFLPQLRELPIAEGHLHAYTCSFTSDSGSVIRAFFHGDADKILTPEIGLSEHLLETTVGEIYQMAGGLGISKARARAALAEALAAQAAFEVQYRAEGQAALAALQGPVVILVGRPYAAYNASANLSLPRKIASRGFHVVPADLLPFDPPPVERNVWYFTQVALSAIRYARQRADTYVCYLSSFSCNPDAIVYHRVRRELEGQPFCFLEVDSHTADAGIVTRIGAFLDIIEERRQLGEKRAGDAAPRPLQGSIDYSGRRPVIVTQNGARLGFDDPRVVHVLLADTPAITSRLFASLYSRLGWRCVLTPFTNAQTLQAARQVCSGRECLPFLSMTGKMVRYLETREPGEVTVFHLLEQEGPCQIGSWFDAVRLIGERLGAAYAFPVWPRIQNNYLGGGEPVAVAIGAAGVLGDLVCEVRTALTSLAEDREGALAALDEMEERLVAAAAHGLAAIELGLWRMARELARIPLAGAPAERPTVLLFSGINRIFVDKPVAAFFAENGILAKTGDVGEFLCFYETEPVVRRGFALGKTSPDEQFAATTLLRGLIRNPTTQPRFQALRARLHVLAIEQLDRHWRRILARSGLVFGPDLHYRQLLRAGHDQVSINGWTEAPCTAGRYLLSLDHGDFDGFVNIGAFNCIPACNATAASHYRAVTSSRPYAVIEADGAGITASQLRQLEAVAAQCWEQKRKERQP
jgi:predicted CoA-substrate-specific enzyme activase